MKKILAYFFTFLVFLGIGFFWVNIQNKLARTKSNRYQGKELSIPQEYCLTQGGELSNESDSLCIINNERIDSELFMFQEFEKQNDEVL